MLSLKYLIAPLYTISLYSDLLSISSSFKVVSKLFSVPSSIVLVFAYPLLEKGAIVIASKSNLSSDLIK